MNHDEVVFEWIWGQLVGKFAVDKRAIFRCILRGTWDSQSYAEMATALNYADSYIQKRLARQLWHVATLELGETVTKKTIKFKAIEAYEQVHASISSRDQPAIAEAQAAAFLDFGSIRNDIAPFGDVGKITSDERFFDRELLLSQLCSRLRGRGSLSLVGEREIGKSSLLSKLCRTGPALLSLPAENFIYLDLQLIHSESMFFEELCKLLFVEESRGYDLLDQLLGDQYILCLDEVEKLRRPEFSPSLRDELRGLADGEDMPFCLVTASCVSLDELFPDESYQTSPLANICELIEVTGFSPEVCRQFLETRLMRSPISFSDVQVETLIEKSQGHPARLQAFAKQLYHQLSQS